VATTRSKSRARPRSMSAPERIRLTGDRLVVRHPDNGERTSLGGLLIPATAAPAPKRCLWGEVTLVGPEVRGAKVGDRILFLPQAGLEVELDGEEYLLLRERDVQAVASHADGTEREPGQYL
jgi:chaperonin GroES